MISNFAQYFAIGMLVIGVLAFLVSIVVEVLKGVFAKLPTDILVFLLSVVLTIIAYFTATSYFKHPVVWYEVVGVIIGGFLVAFVAMYGWSKFSDLYKRFVKEAPTEKDAPSLDPSVEPKASDTPEIKQ